ncbi:MAG: hypothetical protein M1522_00155 [Actinobacteria bacterium]|nr:hypothetical protein [Actinomycetota bacterium]
MTTPLATPIVLPRLRTKDTAGKPQDPAGKPDTTRRHHDAASGTREWVSFQDPEEDRTWMFDLTFLTSRWECIYGRGCQGVLTAPAPDLEEGCCSYGAHLTDDADARRVEAAAATLEPSQWQFWRQGRQRKEPSGVLRRLESGELTTRLVKGACIFLNRPGFPGGAGCALHRAAVERGARPMDLKPDVCWQLPLRREDHESSDGHVTSFVGPWERRHWGGGGEEFHWWCTEDPAAFTSTRPLFETMGDELAALTSPDAYRMLVAYLAG